MARIPDELRALFPEGVAFCCLAVAEAEGGLFAEEAAEVIDAIARRQAEFAAGRDCARRALAGLGVAPCPIRRGARGQPVWPDGIVGAITHCGDICLAAVARAATLRGVGVDLERWSDMTPAVAERVLTTAEREWARAGGPDPRPRQTLLFSAKESLYKCLFPLLGTWLGFDAVVVRPGRDRGDLTLSLAPAVAERIPAGCGLSGRFLLWEDRVFTSVVLRRSAAARPGAALESG